MSKSVVAAALLLAMTGAWYWALMPAVPADPPRPGPGGTPGRVVATVPGVRLDALDAQGDRPTLEYGRNPFGAASVTRAIGAGGGPISTDPAVRPAGAAASSVAEAVAAWPRIELIGVAEGQEAGALVRTAIVAGPRGVQHARVGDVIEQVYRVDRIGADGLEVRLLPEERTLRLVLRP